LTSAPHRRNDARSDRLAETERIADGHHEVAHAQLRAVAQRQRGELVGRNADQRHVGVAVRTEELGLHRAPIRQRHLHVVGVVDHMVVGQHQAFGRIDDHPRAERLIDAFLRHFREQPAEERVVEVRIAYPHHLLGIDADHCRHHPVQHRRQRWHRLPDHRGRQRGRGRNCQRSRCRFGAVVQVDVDGGGDEATEGGGKREREQGRERSHGNPGVAWRAVGQEKHVYGKSS
jgi:hypothetical protein